MKVLICISNVVYLRVTELQMDKLPFLLKKSFLGKAGSFFALCWSVLQDTSEQSQGDQLITTQNI